MARLFRCSRFAVLLAATIIPLPAFAEKKSRDLATFFSGCPPSDNSRMFTTDRARWIKRLNLSLDRGTNYRRCPVLGSRFRNIPMRDGLDGGLDHELFELGVTSNRAFAAFGLTESYR
jgi:hypothetical protein